MHHHSKFGSEKKDLKVWKQTQTATEDAPVGSGNFTEECSPD